MNRLNSEKSPYLKQHAHNPVHWLPWGEAAFQLAREQNKIIFLSIGYSTCHWCHVMERESFVDLKVAQALNDSFISIKVDREELPDVDAFYMSAVIALTGSGGWPLSAFLTPEKEPFFGGTYFPKEHFLSILQQISNHWKSSPSQMKEQAERLTNWIKEKEHHPSAGGFTDSIYQTFFEHYRAHFDTHWGGLSGRPKFPPGYALRVLMRIYSHTENPETLFMIKKTLNEMAKGGIYDQLGGGFHRYSTDEQWLIPHFEKMLYDQASLLHAYTEAFQLTKDPFYKRIAVETADYVLKDLRSPEGGFYSAEDADSEGHEGKFYIWTYQELQDLLSDEEFEAIESAFSVTRSGNFEKDWIALQLKELDEPSPLLNQAKTKLFAHRSTRVRPLRDEKVLTSWNGLFISALAKASQTFQRNDYLDKASLAAEFILKNNVVDGKLVRRWIDGEAKHPALLEDYAFMIDTFLELYQASGKIQWYQEALRFQSLQDTLFSDESGSYVSSISNLHQAVDYEDGVIPSGNSITALNLIRLSVLTGDASYETRLDQLIKRSPELCKQAPWAFAQLVMAFDFKMDTPKEVVVACTEGELKSVTFSFYQDFAPHRVMAFNLSGVDFSQTAPLASGKTMKEGRKTFYICRNHHCSAPTEDLSQAIKESSQTRLFSLDESDSQ